MPYISEDEEYAIDTAMPHMKNLSSVRIKGNLATVLALTRKTPKPKRHPPQMPARGTMIKLYNVSSQVIGINDILEAAKTTLWDKVYLALDDASKDAWDRKTIKQAIEIAKTRGITLGVRNN